MSTDKGQDAMVSGAATAAKLESHEEVCSERYSEIRDAFTQVNGRLDSIVRGLVGLLIAMVAWLLINGVPWEHFKP